jgi:hypothetical protein
MGLVNTPNPKNLGLTVSQVQRSVGLAHMHARPKKHGLSNQPSPILYRFDKHVRPKELELGS